MSLPNRSISLAKYIMSFESKAEFWKTIRKKLTNSPCGWYVTIILPSLIIRSFILGATLWSLSLKSASFSRPRRQVGMYQNITFVHSGLSSTRRKPSRCLMWSRKYLASSNNRSICFSKPSLPLAFHINQNLSTSALLPHWICLSPVS